VKVVTLKLPEDIYLLLKEYANRRNMTVSDIIRKALIKYLKEENPEAKDRPYYGKYIKVTLGEKIAAE
jgi:metal-responsive CopG/Arc/MetJ family transcriptional regulator